MDGALAVQVISFLRCHLPAPVTELASAALAAPTAHSVPALARRVGCSVATMRRRYFAMIGPRPRDLLRVLRACEAVVGAWQGRKTQMELACQTGYSHARSVRACLRDAFGIEVGQLRSIVRASTELAEVFEALPRGTLLRTSSPLDSGKERVPTNGGFAPRFPSTSCPSTHVGCNGPLRATEKPRHAQQ